MYIFVSGSTFKASSPFTHEPFFLRKNDVTVGRVEEVNPLKLSFWSVWFWTTELLLIVTLSIVALSNVEFETVELLIVEFETVALSNVEFETVALSNVEFETDALSNVELETVELLIVE